jgi:hypothetical protein
MSEPSANHVVSDLVEPDIVRSVIVGDLDGPGIHRLFADTQRLVGGSRCYVSISDITKMGTTTAEARRIAKDTPKLQPGLRGVMMYGGGFAQRMISKLVMKAMNVVSSNPIHYDFFADEQSAIAAARKLLRELGQERAHG